MRGTLIKITAIAGLALAATAVYFSLDGASATQDATELASIEAGEFSYYPAGDYLRNGNPVSPAARNMRFEHGFQMMKRQVSQAEYAACVSDGACKALDKAQRAAVAPDLPVVGVSWRDASAYAAWLSARTGHHYRLPSYAEWVYAAGSAYQEEAVVDVSDPGDPAQRWLLEYKIETQRQATADEDPQPFGSFGVNPAGLSDMAGNVWDWTDTCHTRQEVDQAGNVVMPLGENCGIRVVAGKHRSYISDFIRNPKGGACSVGVPPSNLGLRLVRDPDGKGGNAIQSLRSRLGIS
ncbi:MAG: formylglycine-generating enzyme family protein [Pollutimonas bauzanensis]